MALTITKKYAFILIIVLTTFIILIRLSFQLTGSKTNKDQTHMPVHQEIYNQSEIQRDLAINSLTHSSLLSHVDIPYDSIQDKYGKHVQFLSLLTAPVNLVFNFSESNCEECIKSQLPFIRQLAGKIGDDKIIFIGTFTSIRALQPFIDRNEIEFKCYFKEREIEISSYEELNAPYILLADKRKSRFFGLFYPLKEVPEMSEVYFAAISDYF